MPAIRKSLPVQLSSRDSTAAKDGLLTNCYVETTPSGPCIVKRPGYTLSASLTAGQAQGGITFNNAALWVIGDSLASTVPALPSGASWTAATTPTKPTNGSTIGTAHMGYLVSDGTNLFSIGGVNNGDTSVNVYKSVDNGANWTTVATAAFSDNNLSYANYAACWFSGKIRVIHKNTSTGKMEAYSSPTGVTWTKDSSDIGPGAVSFPAIGYVTDGATLYAFFGSNGGGTDGQVWSSTDGVTFTSRTTNPGWKGRDLASVIVDGNGYLYVIGGTTGAAALNDVYKSTDQGVTWTSVTVATSFSARKGALGLYFNNKLWIIGGGTYIFSAVYNDVYSSSDGGANWTTVTASAGWSVRGRPSGCVHNNTLYVGPGQGTGSAIVAGMYYASSGGLALPALPPIANQRFSMCLIPATASAVARVFLKTNNAAYVYDTMTITRVTDADYPAATVPGCATLDGAVYVMDSKGIIYGSDIGDATSWNALNFISAITEADAGVCLTRMLELIVALKDTSIQFFYDAGTSPGSPLAKMDNALLEIGCASAQSVAQSESAIYFIAKTRQKGRKIVKLQGLQTADVSNQWVDRILNADDLATVYSFVVNVAGHVFYFLTLKTSAITLVCVDDKAWFKATKLTAAAPASVSTAVVQSDGTVLVTMGSAHGQVDGAVCTIAGATPSAYNGQVYIRYDTSVHSTSQFSYVPSSNPGGSITGTITATFYTSSYFPGVYYAQSANSDLILDETTGQVYAFDPGTYQDNSLPISVHIRTEKDDWGTLKDKSISELIIVGDTVSSVMLSRYTDDDYQTFSKYRRIDLSKKRPKLTQLGSTPRRAHEFKHSENTALRLYSAEITVDGWGQ
jgi:hypothetical protein